MQPGIAAPLSRKNLRSVTTLLRKHVGLNDRYSFPIVEFMELTLPKLDSDYCFMVVPESEMGNYHGLTLPDKNTVQIREDVYERAVNGSGRDRFTLAHELGHYLLHDMSSVSFARVDPAVKIPAYRNPEWQANAFAGELLMPRHLIVGKNVKEISQLCQVSLSAAQVQLGVRY